MAKLNIVLHEPEIPANTGNIGRTCVATGTRLHLIEPLGFSLSEKALKRAGMDYWKDLDVTTYLDFEDFLARMRSEGFEVKLGKQIAFRPPGQAYFVKTHRLGDAYTKAALMERTGSQRGQSIPAKQPRLTTGRPGKLLIDIQAKIQAGKGKGYERWARIFNLQEAAKTLNFLIDNNLTDYDQLAALADNTGVLCSV